MPPIDGFSAELALEVCEPLRPWRGKLKECACKCEGDGSGGGMEYACGRG